MKYLDKTGLAYFWEKIKAYVDNKIPSSVVEVYSATKNVKISTASIDTYVTGASMTVPAGTYVVTGQWKFEYSSASGSRNMDIDLLADSTLIARERVFSAGNNYASLNVSSIVELSSETVLCVKGSCSKTTTSAVDTWVKAVRVK